MPAEASQQLQQQQQQQLLPQQPPLEQPQQQRMMSSSASNWESLRKHARQLEHEIDSQLVSYAKIASSTSASSSSMNGMHGSSSSSYYGVDSLAAAQTAEHELEDLLKQLTASINAMTVCIENSGTAHPSAASMSHLLQRHRANLFEYNREFQKTKSSIISKREHVELLSSIRNDVGSFRSGAGGSSQEYYLTERGRMESAHNMVDEILQQAMDSRDDLEKQKSSLFGTRGRLSTVMGRFPQLANVLGRINTRRTRDSWILGTVIGVCMCIIMWYAIG
ncbi:hypothetical protein BC831DRAFT_474679 [Entophlyctis helioformis]|nr:hypothetical protein BC831DRAFT_474679 [Entophlyctis helioformis]